MSYQRPTVESVRETPESWHTVQTPNEVYELAGDSPVYKLPGGLIGRAEAQDYVKLPIELPVEPPSGLLNVVSIPRQTSLDAILATLPLQPSDHNLFLLQQIRERYQTIEDENRRLLQQRDDVFGRLQEVLDEREHYRQRIFELQREAQLLMLSRNLFHDQALARTTQYNNLEQVHRQMQADFHDAYHESAAWFNENLRVRVQQGWGASQALLGRLAEHHARLRQQHNRALDALVAIADQLRDWSNIEGGMSHHN
jgi:hypothetical protein